MKLHLSKDFSLPIDSVTQTFAVLAKRGVGKTHNSSVMAEEMLKAGQHVVAIDPTGAWWGLRSGFPIVIFGGEHADVPIEDTAGEVIAQAIVEGRISAVIDVSLFRKGQARRFLIAFLETLYRLNRDAVHLFVDEADDVCPQKPFGDEAHLVGALEDVVKRGRKKGIGCSLITQRPAALNKDVLTQCEILVAMRLVHPLDIKAIKEWVNVHADPDLADTMIKSLPSLPIGEAWFWAPGWGDIFQRVKVRPRETFDSSSTPKPGEKAQKPKQLQPVDLEALGAQIKATVERQRENDPAALKKRIRELEAHVPASDDRAIARAVEQCRREVRNDLLRFIKERDAAIEQLQNRIKRAAHLLDIGGLPIVAPPTADELRVVVSSRNGHQSRPAASVTAAVSRQQQPVSAVESGLTGPEQRILNAIAWLESIGNMQPSQTAVAFLAGYTTGGGAWNNPRGSLRAKGLIEYRSDALVLTEAGRALATLPDAILTTEELHLRVMNRLPGPEQKILAVLLDSYPRAESSEDVAARAGYQAGGGAFNNPKGRLRSLGLIDYPGAGMMKAADVLFLDGSR